MSPQGSRILIIDDDFLILTGLRYVIESWGYVALTASDQDDALVILNSEGSPPDLILADYRLGNGVTGAEVVARARSLFAKAIPAMLITGDTAPERIREASAHGLPLMHKPVGAKQLREAVEKLLEK
jgi:CheY-like chemotaxis protein